MKKLILIILALSLQMSYAQEIHSPRQIFQILEKSDVVYKIEITDLPFPIPNRSNHLNRNDYYVTEEDGNISVLEYEIDDDAKIHIDLAESHFRNRRFADARSEYYKVLEVSPEYYKVLTYIAQTYGMEGDLDKALEIYKQAIEKNRIDFLAHMLIADIFKLQGDYEKAAYHITYAQILNRNNPRINAWRQEIYSKAKMRKQSDFIFHPQIKLSADEDVTEVEILATQPWLLYSLAKAVWEYEPGYAESQGKAEGEFSMLEEKEAIVCLLTYLDNAKRKEKKKPEFAALQKALDASMLDEFIVYELWLLDYPWIAYGFSESFMNYLVDYVMHVRGGKKLAKK